MTQAEWEASSDPAVLLAWVREVASERQLRAFACACCQRVWEEYPLPWAQQVFERETADPGGHVQPADWTDERPRAAVRVAAAFAAGQASVTDLERAHEAAWAFASDIESRWQFANYKLGDSATWAEVTVGFVAACAAAAACAASSPHIRHTVLTCVERAARALFGSFEGWQESSEDPGVLRVKQTLARILRELIEFPRREPSPGAAPDRGGA
jgi:hypothetical protein